VLLALPPRHRPALDVQSVVAVKPMRFLSFPVLGFTADLVTLSRKPTELIERGFVMYLGQAGNTTVLYLVQKRDGQVVGGQLVRVPSNQLVISDPVIRTRRPAADGLPRRKGRRAGDHAGAGRGGTSGR
jgi:hypothetical protein